MISIQDKSNRCGFGACVSVFPMHCIAMKEYNENIVYPQKCQITNALLPKIIGKISAFTILQYVNFFNYKPVGKINYTLN